MHYISHLSRDAHMKKLIREHGHFTLKKKKKLWLYLCYSIMSQQLSSKVATIIKERFLDLYGGEPEPEQVIEMPFAQLRNIGLSNAKVHYIQNVARFQLEHGLEHKKLGKMNNEEVIEYVTQIKGVGRWTAEMMLMFALCREDLFALDDLGLRNAVKGIYGLKHRKKKTEDTAILKIAEKWSPYRTYACLYLWHWKDNPPPVKKRKP